MAGHATRIGRRALPVAAVAAVAMLLVPFVQRARADQPAAADAAAAVATACAGDHWVGGWRAAPQGSSLGRPGDADGPSRTFADQTLRMIVSSRVGGSAVRVHLGNRHGTAPVVVGRVTVAERADGAALVPESVRTLTFGGSPSITIAPGDVVRSDPTFIPVEPFVDLALSFHVVGAAVLDHHQWATTTSYAAPAGSGDHASDAGADAFTEPLASWYGVAGVDVLTARDVGAVVTLGDSITDGVGSSIDADRRWPDALARRLGAAGTPLSVVNAGIGGNHVVTSGLTSDVAVGPSAAERLDRDVLEVDGATDVFVFEGINDLFNAQPGTDITTALIDGYRAIIDRAHAAGLRVVGATITPGNLTDVNEAARQTVNEWIRTSGAYDAVVDFDTVVRDPANPRQVRAEWDAGFAHLNDAGYEALAAAIPLEIFQGTGC